MATVNLETKVIVVTEDYLRQIIREELARSTAYVPPPQVQSIPAKNIDNAIVYNADEDPNVALAAQSTNWK